MKKSFTFLCAIILYISAYAVNGDGSSGNPFWGSITTTVQWSVGDFSGSTVYIGTSANPDLTVGDGGHLIIDPGITVIFTQLTSDLFITGTGQLTAGGTGLQVTFTKDSSISHWGHISFQSMYGTPASSTFDNCILEHGYSTGTDKQPLFAGGALQIDFNGVIITNCIFKNNYATFAGAVMINSTRNTIIRNSYFESNEAYEAGGAIVIYGSSTALIENCIFYFNYCKGTSYASYSGGAIWSYSNTAKVINCTFTENTSDRPGDSFFSYSSSGTKLVNSILWGSNDQYAASGTKCTVTYCAFETTKPSNATYSIVISDVADDHFNNAGAGDWSLKYISPCRDAGTNSYGIPNIVPITDYLGNSRVLTTDIGAFEVQYSRWKTTASSTDWSTAANWDGGVPTSLRDVVVPTGATNYPTGSTTQDFTLGSGKQMIIEQGARVTLDDLTNNGILKLNATSAGFASLIINSYTRGGGGTEEIQIFLTGGGTKTPLTYKWHYISSPVTSLAVSTFAPTYTFNIWGWFENRPTSTLSQGWVAYDGYYPGGWDYPRAFSTLDPGKGYDYFKSTDYTYTFGGLFNTGNVNASLNYTSGDDNLYGYNLLGNPFSSGLDWDYIITHSFPANTSKGLYFTRNSVSCTYINGVGVPGDVTGIIPPMQGFFSKTYSSGNTIVLAAAARTHDDIHATYKGSKELIPLVRLELKDDTLSDETVVRFDEEAKSYLDNDFDAVKMFLDPDLSSIYSSVSGIDYCINGLPFPETIVEIPVTVNIVTDLLTKSITATQLQGLDDYDVTLTDNSTGFSADLKTIPAYSFSALKGTITDRFVLKISHVATAIETPAQTTGSFNIYHGFGLINIQTIEDAWEGKSGSVKLLDMTGRSVYDIRNAEFRKNSLISIQAPSAKGLYLVEIQSGMMKYVGKVIVK